ncbi:hypothetical protein M9H77_15529 [Catharanthus roseus]|uniref:Uncharacterized protein n=1 Tax=Catharanthus roseus TaxID=4058 RepID=A0ACC0AYI0_CATRO|nr:hypothetical protein M9H77_15529 [Catharanthus roseus]
MTSRQHVRYSRLADDEDDFDSESRQNDNRFDYLPKSYNRIPWKSIFLALFLLVLGCLLIILAALIFGGHMAGDSSQAYSLLGLGLLAFLPGFYETRIAYYSWRGAQGYQFSSIPDY